MLQYITCIATAGILPYHTQKPLYSSYVTDLFAHLAHVANTFSWHTILKKLAHFWVSCHSYHVLGTGTVGPPVWLDKVIVQACIRNGNWPTCRMVPLFA